VKLIFAVLVVLVIALVAVDFFASRVAEKSYIETLRQSLEHSAKVIAAVHAGRMEQLDRSSVDSIAAAASARLTLVAPDGLVITDSEAEPDRMENHAARPEVSAALGGQPGSSSRLSPTTGIQYLYVAVPVPEGALRLAVPLSEVKTQTTEVRRQMLVATGVAFLPAILVAAFFARYYSARLGAIIDYARKLAEGNFEATLTNTSRDELGTLGRRLNETGEKLQKMFKALEREHAELEKLERIRRDFVINVSHELRTPLASIQGYTETLMDGALHDPAHNMKFLGIIRQNAERLGRLTADLLTLSRIELKTQKFQFAAYYVNRLITDSVDSLRPMAAKKNISISIDPAPEATEVFCDTEAVHQILTNLIDNALKYTPEGGAIFVSARSLSVSASGSDEMVEVSVRDTGIGIPELELPRLFERFYRVDKARSRELGGTGLGLAIVKHLVRAQGGEVKISSRLNEGSIFSFTLPVHDLGLLEYSSVQAEVTSL
jgi:two-component system, OmpR family, phosphate regulon sensor histidine kinase PhoR